MPALRRSTRAGFTRAAVSKLRDLSTHLRALRTIAAGVSKGLPALAAMPDPLGLFSRWFEDAEASGLPLPESMALATATPAGRPSVRMVLLKGYGPGGFRFFTNYESSKAADLDANPRAALCFHWATLVRQVRVEGRVERLTAEESAEYFGSRARGSQIGAWASRQSRPIDGRAELEAQVARAEARFRGKEVPLPDSWGGYLLVPRYIEFWQGRSNRLHDRIAYSGGEDAWEIARLQP